jgi:hypothetical protein
MRLFIVLWALMLGNAFQVFAQDTENPFEQEDGARTKADLSPQQACDYFSKTINGWSEKHPAGARGASTFSGGPAQVRPRAYTMQDVDDLAHKAGALGPSNLLVVEVAMRHSFAGDLTELCEVVLNKAMDLTLKDNDLPLVLDAAAFNPGLLPYAWNRWKETQRDEIFNFVSSELSRLTDHRDNPSTFAQAMAGIASSNSAEHHSADVTVTKDSQYLGSLLDLASKVSNSPVLNKKISALMEDAAQNGDSYDYPILYVLYQQSPPENKAGLLSALQSDKFRKQFRTNQVGTLVDLMQTLCLNPSLCANSQMQKAATALADSTPHDDNPGSEMVAAAVKALVGDQDSFKKVVEAFSREMEKANRAMPKTRGGMIPILKEVC